MTAIVLAAVLVASGVVLVQSRGDGDDGPAGGEQAGGEVFLEAAGEPGTDPFTESVAGEVFVPASTPPFPSTTAPPEGQTAVLTSAGSTPGLYGGTRDESRCDVAQLTAFLEGDATKAAAWAAVPGIDPGEIPAYLAELTPLQLRVDTRVTNHGFRDGRATPRQAVLQAGTAVLIDETGVPRVKCGCGNPLAPPQPVATAPQYTGSSWDGFSPATIVVVQPGPVVEVFVVVDPRTDEPFARPVGTDGEADTDAPDGLDVSDPLGSAQVTTDTTAGGDQQAVGLFLKGEVALLPEVAAQVIGDVKPAVSAFVLDVTADGTLRGSFSITMLVAEEDGCSYRSELYGDLTGTLTGSTLSGTWTGGIAEDQEAGDCSSTFLVNEGATGSFEGTLDAGAASATGTISLEGDALLGFEAQG